MLLDEADPVWAIPDVGPVSAQRLEDAGYHYVGDLQGLTQSGIQDIVTSEALAAHIKASVRPPTDPEDEEDVLILDTKLTGEKHGGTECLATTESIPSGERAPYNPSVLQRWADELSQIDGHVEVGLGPLKKNPEHSTTEGETTLALYAVVPDSEVVGVAVPLNLPEEPEFGVTHEVSSEYDSDGGFEATEVPPNSMPGDLGEWEFPHANEGDSA